MFRITLIVLALIMSGSPMAATAADAPTRHLERQILNSLELEGRLSSKVNAVTERLPDSSTASTPSLCFTNPDVIAGAAQLALDHFSAKPESAVFYLWPDRAECRCDNCRKLDSASSHSGSYAHLITKTAGRVASQYPQKKIGYVAVGEVANPPSGVVLPDNVVVMIPLVSGAIDASCLDLVAQWSLCASDIAAHVEYPWSRLLPGYRPRQAVEELAALRRAGVSSFTADVTSNALSEPLVYLVTRMMKETSAKPEQTLDEYFVSRYDSWAPAVGEFYATLQAASVDATDYGPDCAAMEKAWQSLRTAKQTAFGHPRERIEELEKEFLPAYLPARAYRLASSAGSRPIRGMADLAASTADLQNALESAVAAERVYGGYANEVGLNELTPWQDKMISLLRSGAKRIKQWTTANLADEEAEIALTELTYRLLDNPWAERAKLPEIF